MGRNTLDVWYFPKGIFPSGNFPRVISQAATSQSLPKSALPMALGPLAHPSRSARPPIAACGASEGLI